MKRPSKEARVIIRDTRLPNEPEVPVVVRRFKSSDVIVSVEDSCKDKCSKLAGVIATEQARIDGENRRRRQDDHPWVRNEVAGGIVRCGGRFIVCQAEIMPGTVVHDGEHRGFYPEGRPADRSASKYVQDMNLVIDSSRLDPEPAAQQ